VGELLAVGLLTAVVLTLVRSASRPRRSALSIAWGAQ